jgi:hypothetical protein
MSEFHHSPTKEKNRERFRKNDFDWLNRSAGAGNGAIERLETVRRLQKHNL